MQCVLPADRDIPDHVQGSQSANSRLSCESKLPRGERVFLHPISLPSLSKTHFHSSNSRCVYSHRFLFHASSASLSLQVQDFLIHFWQGMPTHMLPILGCQATVDLVVVCDFILYRVSLTKMYSQSCWFF